MSRSPGHTPSRSERLYRRLLRLYPRGFREAFGEAMVVTFRDHLHDRRSRRGRLGLGIHWARTLLDLGRTVPAEWLRIVGPGRSVPTEGSPGRSSLAHRLGEDVRQALRSLVRTPRLTAAVVVTLALGIGVVAAFFSLLNAAWFRPLPYPDGHELVELRQLSTGEALRSGSGVDPALRAALRTGRAPVDAVGVFRDRGTRNLITEAWTAPVRVVEVGPRLFGLLGVRPALGRLLGPGDAWTGASTGVVLSHGTWSTRFDADPGVLGRTVRVDGVSMPVVGVMPPGFAFPERGEAWIPLADPATASAPLRVVARLTSPRESAREALDALARRATEAGVTPPGTRLVLTGLVNRGRHVDPGPIAWLLVGTAVAVLLVACSNVASLLLARSARRRSELAVRAALGASRRRLLAQALVEGGLLAAVGCLAGLALAAWLPDALLQAARIPAPSWFDPVLDHRVAAFAAVVSALTVVVFALPPGLESARVDLERTLRSGGQGSTGSRRARRMRSLVVAAEVALAFVLVAGGGLLATSVASLARADVGGAIDDVIELGLSLTSSLEADPGERQAFLDAVVETGESRPGIAAVAVTGRPSALRAGPRDSLPMAELQRTDAVAEGGTTLSDTRLRWEAVDPSFFRARGLALLEGRGFELHDAADAPPVVVLSRSVADALWPAGSAVGRHLRVGGPDPVSLRVVGIAEDRRRLEGFQPGDVPRMEAEPLVYLPRAQAWTTGESLLVRAGGATEEAARVVREAIREVDPDQAVTRIAPPDRVIHDLARALRVGAVLVLSLAGAGALLAALGLYGLLAQGVAERTREIGIRTALGGGPRTILRSVVGDALRLVGAGVATGIVLTLLAVPVLRGLLFGVEPADPLILAGVVLLFLSVAAAASVGPTRRALALDPVRALRAE